MLFHYFCIGCQNVFKCEQKIWIVKIVESIIGYFDEKMQIDVIYTDLETAFDKVDQNQC